MSEKDSPKGRRASEAQALWSEVSMDLIRNCINYLIYIWSPQLGDTSKTHWPVLWRTNGHTTAISDVHSLSRSWEWSIAGFGSVPILGLDCLTWPKSPRYFSSWAMIQENVLWKSGKLRNMSSNQSKIAEHWDQYGKVLKKLCLVQVNYEIGLFETTFLVSILI